MNTKKGFTLVELLVVIAILAILATVSVVGYTSFIDRANQSNAQTEVHQVESIVKSYNLSGEEYVIATIDTAEYVATVDANGYVVITLKGAQTTTYLTASDLENEDFAWTDFTDIASKLTVGTNGRLEYKYGDNKTDYPINLNDNK